MKMDVDERDQPCFFWRHFSVIVPALLLCSCNRSAINECGKQIDLWFASSPSNFFGQLKLPM